MAFMSLGEVHPDMHRFVVEQCEPYGGITDSKGFFGIPVVCEDVVLPIIKSEGCLLVVLMTSCGEHLDCPQALLFWTDATHIIAVMRYVATYNNVVELKRRACQSHHGYYEFETSFSTDVKEIASLLEPLSEWTL